MTVNSNLSLEFKKNLPRIIYKVSQSCTWLCKCVSIGFTRVKEEYAKLPCEKMFWKKGNFYCASLRTLNRLWQVRKNALKGSFLLKKYSIHLEYVEDLNLVPISTLNPHVLLSTPLSLPTCQFFIYKADVIHFSFKYFLILCTLSQFLTR